MDVFKHELIIDNENHNKKVTKKPREIKERQKTIKLP